MGYIFFLFTYRYPYHLHCWLNSNDWHQVTLDHPLDNHLENKINNGNKARIVRSYHCKRIDRHNHLDLRMPSNQNRTVLRYSRRVIHHRHKILAVVQSLQAMLDYDYESEHLWYGQPIQDHIPRDKATFFLTIQNYFDIRTLIISNVISQTRRTSLFLSCIRSIK